jgi:ubiquinol-cytochrome c reductase cytochrome c subunit
VLVDRALEEHRGWLRRFSAGRRARFALLGGALLLGPGMLTAAAWASASPAASPSPATSPSLISASAPPTVSSPAGSPEATPSVNPSAEAAAGDPSAEVFLENCSGCHGTRGEGAFGPPLAPAGFASLVATMVEEGGIQMPSFSDQLSDTQIQGVAGYVASTIADPASHAAVASDGGVVYRLYCSGCHSTTGRGGALTRGRNAPNIAQYPPAEALAAMILGRGNMPVFAGNTLDVTQQTAVALYVEHLVPPASPGGAGLGYLGPVPEGAVGALALLTLIFVAVWLAWKSRRAAA